MKKLTTKVQVLYALGVSYAIVDQIFAQWILYFYLPSESSGLKPFMAPVLVSIALAISRLVDMVTDPLVGFLSDKYNSKYGRRRFQLLTVLREKHAICNCCNRAIPQTRRSVSPSRQFHIQNNAGRALL